MVGRVPVDTSGFDFSDRSSNVRHVKTANAALITLVGLFVALRILVRAFMVRKLFVDDCKIVFFFFLGETTDSRLVVLIMVAAAFTIALAAVCIAGTSEM